MEYYRERFHEYLNDTWPVSIDVFSWDSASVFRSMSPKDYEASFNEWHQSERKNSKERALEFLQETECLERFFALIHRVKLGNVVPFVGAGLSIPSGFQPWGEFLLSLLADAPQARQAVRDFVAVGKFEEAAQVAFDSLGPDAFAEEISNRLGRREVDVLGPVRLLPQLFQGEIVTTNFDDVLSSSYADSGNAFAREISGAALRAAPAQLGADRHCLLRLHGEARSAEGRVLTMSEYDETYDEARAMSGLLEKISGIRSFLFLGCSLSSDRMLSALRKIKSDSPQGSPAHYAFLPLPAEDERNARRLFLGEAGIHPIYYPAHGHDQCIEDMLIAMMQSSLNA